MGQYLVTYLENEGEHSAQSAANMSSLIEERRNYAGELKRKGVLKDSARLRPSREGKRVRIEQGTPVVTDGPFPREDRAFSGYDWVEASSLEEAAEIALECPNLPGDELDVRPIMKGLAPENKEAKPGKLFVCAVLGNAPTEDAWVRSMDRIDTESQNCFPEGAFLGGLRLQPPRNGKRVQSQGDRRAVVDGPFLESKEVIGGVFVLRAASIEDAVRWALTTPFIVHGALEIRELWRT